MSPKAPRPDAEILDGQARELERLIKEAQRLQREVTDKTDRLGRLAVELGELKAKGIGKIFR